MAEIINLRNLRKAKSRRQKQAEAAENRVRFGRTKAEKRESTVEQKRSEKTLNDKRLD